MNTEEYAKLAACEDSMWYFRESHRLFLDTLEKAGIPNAGALLDAGCGTGGWLKRLKELRPDLQLHGIDFSPLACEQARARTDGSIEQGSIDAMPYESDRFDAATSIDVLECVDSPKRALAEIFRCLKPGGFALINVPAMGCLMSRHDAASATVRRFERESFRSDLTESGFEVVSIQFWNALLWPLVWLRRKVFAGESYESDVHPYPKLLDVAFGGVLGLERWLMKRGVTWPWGVSLLALARKPKEIAG